MRPRRGTKAMRHRLHSLTFILILALGLSTALGAASPEWALTASLNKVFLVKYDGGTVTSYEAGLLSDSSLTGIGTYHGYIFVADSATSGIIPSTTLHVGRMADPLTNPTIQWLGDPIRLEQGANLLKQPGAVAVDANGGVYVLGGRWSDGSNMHSNYAYVSSGDAWAHSTVNIVDLPTTALMDISATGVGSQAVIANRGGGFWFDQTCATGANGASASAPNPLNDGGYFPRGIAAGANGFSYIANYSTELTLNAGPSNVGSISVINSVSLGKASEAFQLGEFRPTDIAFMALGGLDYLGIVGVTTGGVSQALRLTIDPATGLPIMNTAVLASLDGSSGHYAAGSADGSLFWATNPQANTVTVLDTLSWQIQSVTVAGSASYIAGWVPEPSSIVALLTGGIGLLGLRRRRKHS